MREEAFYNSYFGRFFFAGDEGDYEELRNIAVIDELRIVRQENDGSVT